MSGTFAVALLGFIALAVGTPQNMVGSLGNQPPAQPNQPPAQPNHGPSFSGNTPSMFMMTHSQAKPAAAPGTILNNLHVQSVAITWTLELCDKVKMQCAFLNVRRTPKAEYQIIN